MIFIAAIFVGSFGSKMSFEDIKKKVLQFDEEVIGMNALENLQKMMPTKEQVCILSVRLWYEARQLFTDKQINEELPMWIDTIHSSIV